VVAGGLPAGRRRREGSREKGLCISYTQGTLPPHRPDLGPCWENTYSVEGNGYKQMRLHGRLIMIHRFVWVLHFGHIEDGLDIHHLCTNRGCCRIEHLEKMTRKEHLHKTDVFNPTTTSEY